MVAQIAPVSAGLLFGVVGVDVLPFGFQDAQRTALPGK
jgi:hypothetical protein